MIKLSKRMKNILSKINIKKKYLAIDAFNILKNISSVNFVESIDTAITLGVDPRKSDQNIKGFSILPNGIGRNIKVIVFAKGSEGDAAKDAGADAVGMEDLASDIKNGNIDFDVVIASPYSMKIVGELGQILGPRGLMPNLKFGTLNKDVVKAVVNAKTGQVRYKVDKSGIIHTTIGKINFTSIALKQNLEQLLNDLKKIKPPLLKGIYFKNISVSSTMGPGINLDFLDLNI